MAHRAHPICSRATAAIVTATALVVAIVAFSGGAFAHSATPSSRQGVWTPMTYVALTSPLGGVAAKHPDCDNNGNGGAGGNGGWFGGSNGQSGQPRYENGKCVQNGANGTSGPAVVVISLIVVLVLGAGLFLVLRRRSRKKRAASSEAEE
jgi:hypothetical protein